LPTLSGQKFSKGYIVLSDNEKESILKQHTNLVKKIANIVMRRLSSEIELDDLIQAGMIGMLDAADRFDSNGAAKFETFATHRIRGAMFDMLRKQGGKPRSHFQKIKKVAAAINLLQQQLVRKPTEEEVANKLGISLAEYQKILVAIQSGSPASLDDDQDDEEYDDSRIDSGHTEASADPLEQLSLKHKIRVREETIKSLPERQQLVIEYVDQGLTLKEIGEKMGISKSTVYQLKAKVEAEIKFKLRRM